MHSNYFHPNVRHFGYISHELDSGLKTVLFSFIKTKLFHTFCMKIVSNFYSKSKPFFTIFNRIHKKVIQYLCEKYLLFI